MKIEIGNKIKGIDIEGNKTEGKVIDILRKINIVQVRVDGDRNDITNCELKDIEKVEE